MSDTVKPPDVAETPGGSGDPIEHLIRIAGPRPPVPDERAARVKRSVHQHWRRTVERERRRGLAILIGTRLGAAAALALVVLGGLWVRDRMRAPGAAAGTVVRSEGRVRLSDGRRADAGSVVTEAAGLTTGVDGRAALRLGGGPSIRLDADTDLRLISSSVLELRHGALYVDTGASPLDASSSIEIRTPLGRVRDMGTQFAVRLADDLLDVSVREGTAALTRGDRTYTAPAGTRLRVDPRGTVTQGAVEPGGTEWDWVLAVAPPFEMEGRTLRDYLGWVSRETGWRVTFADPSIAVSAGTVVLHGSTSGMRPDETPAAVLPTCGLRHRLDGGALVIERADAGAGR